MQDQDQGQVKVLVAKYYNFILIHQDNVLLNYTILTLLQTWLCTICK